MHTCSDALCQFFRPPELEQLICGGRELDLEALEGATLYDDGYTAQSQVQGPCIMHAISSSCVVQWFMAATVPAVMNDSDSQC